MRDATDMVKAGDIVELKSSRLSGMIGYITKEDGHMVINGLSPEMDNQHVDMQYIPSDEINRVYRGDFSRDLERLAKNRTASPSAGFWAYDNLKNHLEQTRPVLIALLRFVPLLFHKAFQNLQEPVRADLISSTRSLASGRNPCLPEQSPRYSV